MKSNSDNSDYEDENLNADSSNLRMKRKKQFQSYFSEQGRSKKHRAHKNSYATKKFTVEKQSLDSNDSDYDGNFLKDFDKADSEMKFRSHDIYQNSSCEQDSNDEYVSPEIQFEKVNETASTCTDKGEGCEKSMIAYPDLSDEDSDDQFEKQEAFLNTNDNADSSKDSLHCDTSKPRQTKCYTSPIDAMEKHKQQNLNRLKDDANLTIEKTHDAKEESNATKPCNTFDGGDKAQRIMRMMGYQAGHGLGKNKQGRLEPVEAPKQHGRRGLGHHVPGLQASGFKWTAAEEEIKVKEDMKWLSNTNTCMPTLEEMQTWLKKGPKKNSVADETNFCNLDIVTNVINSKSVFDKLDKIEMHRAKIRSNPYETIRGAFFLNRAAVKMANMDKACNFMFTSPENLNSSELLYFADVCAGPGGFSEYVLWRKKWHAKGFGFTLKNKNDFKLSDFHAGPCETFHPFYGPKDNGDVFDPANQEAFHNLIMEHTNGKGVHFMMSDGGFSVQGQENIQEILSKQLYLCQCLVALMIVRTNGHFVTKLFDLFTPFSAGLVYLMYRCFDEICIFKPNSSRPANSERYLICKRKRAGVDGVVQYLKHVNHLLLRNDDSNDASELASLEELENEGQFVQYLRESNEELGKKQVIGLRKIAAFCEDTTLIETKQADMRKQCLEYWEIPDESRTVPRYLNPQERLKTLLKNSTKILSSVPLKLTIDNFKDTIVCQPYDWFCMPCGSGMSTDTTKTATFYMGMGRTNVYRYVSGMWQQVSDVKLVLPPDTLLYAEVVYEYTKESRNQQKVLALHILDAFMLGAEDISELYLEKRHELITKFCDALWKPSANDCGRIRAKDLCSVSRNLDERLQLKPRTMKGIRQALAYEFSKTPLDHDNVNDDVSYFIPHSILFLKSTARPWCRNYSKTHSTTYVFNTKTRATEFDIRRPAVAEASFIESFENRIIWYWPDDETLTMSTFMEQIKQKCPEHNQRL